MKFYFETNQLLGIGRAEIEARRSVFRDGVHRGAAFDGADVPGRSRRVAELEGRQPGDDRAHQDDWVWQPGIRPGMSPGSGDSDEESPASQSLGHRDLVAGAIQDDDWRRSASATPIADRGNGCRAGRPHPLRRHFPRTEFPGAKAAPSSFSRTALSAAAMASSPASPAPLSHAPGP